VTAALHATDQSSSSSPRSVLSSGHRGLTVGIVAVVFLIAFEAMAVATAMPVAVRDLDGLPAYAWAFSGFLSASLFAMVSAGEWSDRRGPRQPLLAGIVAFGVGLVLAGTAAQMPVFIVGRAAQGVGAGFIIVAIYVVVARAYSEEMRPRVFSALASAWVLPSIVGPVIAGYLADAVSWRAVFLGVLPLLIPAALMVLPRLGRFEGASAVDMPAGAPGRTRSAGARRRGLALAAAAGAAVLQYAGQHLVWSSVLVAVAGLALLAPSVPRLLPPGSLRFARGLPTTVVMRGVLAASFFGAETFVPLMLVEHRGLATATAGLCLTGAALGWASASWYQGRPQLRVRRSRLIQIGCLAVAVAIGGVALVLLPAVPPVVAAVAWTVGGLGMGVAMASVSLLTLQQSPVADQGANSAALQLSDALGGVVFIGLGGAIFAAGTRSGWSLPVTFAVIYLIMAAVAVVGFALAHRVRPAG
jgi:MFS family permease